MYSENLVIYELFLNFAKGNSKQTSGGGGSSNV